MSTYSTTSRGIYVGVDPVSFEEIEKLFKEIGEYFSNLYGDIIANTKTVLKDTYTESENLVKAQYDAWKDSISQHRRKGL